MTDRQLIESGADELAARQGFSNWRDMRQRDLEYLCERIEGSSGILISLSTIKRILNGQYNRLPQVATLNALAVYLGYADWQAFRLAKGGVGAEGGQTNSHAAAGAEVGSGAGVKVAPQVWGAARMKGRQTRVVIGAGVVAVLLLVVSWRYFSRSPKTGGAASFSVRKTTQNAIPNTVVFTYDVGRVGGDSFFIQQSWDRDRRVRIDRRGHTLTDIYYEPGYHVAKLFANDRIVKTVDVSIPTDGWCFYSKETLIHGLPSYIHTGHPVHDGHLGLDRQTLLINRVDPEKPQVYLYTWFPKNISADADNCRLTARIKMTDVRNNAFPWIMSEIYCQRSFMYSMYTLPGCTGAICAQYGDRFIDGKDNDLSSLAFDVRQWHDIDILVRQRRVTVSVDGKPVLKTAYPASNGMITGLGFHSNGLCEVDSIRLTGLDGTVVYPR
ncbi:MAG TPA: hypothetical protein VMH27_10415 [Puia sp.]|nr:hypothetical protein [Puia sp.]